MQAKYFSDTDTLLLQFNNREIVETYDLNEDVLVEADKDGIIVSMTIERSPTAGRRQRRRSTVQVDTGSPRFPEKDAQRASERWQVRGRCGQTGWRQIPCRS